MDLRGLRAFVEVVRQGGFSKAGEVIFATQSTVSKAVKHLEDELGVLLLDRRGQQAKLTAAGEIAYRRACSMLIERDDLVSEIGELRGLKRGSLKIGFSVGSSILFAPLFASYRTSHPGIDVQFAMHGHKRLKELLLSGELDLAAMLLPLPGELQWQDVYTEPLVALMHHAHPLAERPSVTLEDLANSSFVLFEEDAGINRVVLDACERKGFAYNIVARSRQIDFLVELVALGLGIAFLPRMLLERRHHPLVRFAILDEPRTEWHIALAWRRDGYLSHAARAWLDMAREARRGG
ncbi:MAG TPA: LysR family transcriptional regulator [Ramlibacter sp.]|uniref:LysR family transcriptional regulator n=1 Tax=Ramlibacter sp. TaxID=1917967 RepID=UPI002C12A83A|nr:LysR family transcriptional regulator [Ramlibacter sp.]HVZ44255.1 LysR family transcriptional regulator [Ramlibacter sp.]